MLMSAGIEPPQGWAIGGWLLSGGEKMSKTSGNVVNPLDLIDEVGLDGFRYYVLADTAYGNDGDFTYEGLVTRYNSDLANNLGNLLARVATVVGKKCDGVGPAAGSVEPPRRRRRQLRTPTPSPAGTSSSRAAPSTPRGSSIRATNAYLETNEPWKADPGPAVDARDGRRARSAADRGDPRAAGDARHRPSGLGAHRHDAARSSTNDCPTPRPGVGTRRGRRHQGRRPVPPPDGLTRPMPNPAIRTRPQQAGSARRGCSEAGSIAWFDSHCHIHDERIPDGADGAVEAARAAGVATMVTVGCDRATSLAAIAVAGAFDDVYATVGLHPHEAANGVDTIVDLFDTPGIVAVGEAGLDYYYEHSPRDVQQRRVRRADPARPRAARSRS